MMRLAAAKVREHDGTNTRGLTRNCPTCGSPLIPVCESEVCERCLRNKVRPKRAGEGKR